MTEDCKRWACKLAGFSEVFIGPSQWVDYDLEILIKAMWAINREGLFKIQYEYFNNWYYFVSKRNGKGLQLNIKDHKYSEQEELTAALTYGVEQGE